MKTNEQTTIAAAFAVAESIEKSAQTRARARAAKARKLKTRARVLLALGLITRGEAGAVSFVRPRSGRAEYSTRGAHQPAAIHRGGEAAAVEAERARAAGLLTAAEVEAIRRAAVQAARLKKRGLLTAAEVEAIRRAELRAARAAREAEARAAGNRESIARLHRAADRGDGARWLVVEGEGRRLVVEARKNTGAGGRGMDRADVERRRIQRLAARARMGIGRPISGTDARTGAAVAMPGSGSWFNAAADQATAELLEVLHAQTRARAGALLRLGLHGRAAARVARIGWAAGRRWLRRNSRREALALAEVGSAAGVDDLQAGADWALELMAISGAIHQRAGVYGAVIASAPLTPCRALVARGLSGGATSNLRAAALGRGHRVDGAPVVEWTERGRVVREDSLGIIGRAGVWIWAARAAGRAMHSARYGRGGRDGREVPAGWSICGRLDERADVTRTVAPSRRPSFVRAARGILARGIVEARRGVMIARHEAGAAVTGAERAAAGRAIGAARRALSAARDRAAVLGAAIAGRAVAPDKSAAWVTPDGSAMTDAGRKLVARVRVSAARVLRDLRRGGRSDEARKLGAAMRRARLVAAVQASGEERAPRPDWGAVLGAGDEVAAAQTVAPYAPHGRCSVLG